MLRHSPLGKES